MGIIPILDDGTCCWGAIDIDIYEALDVFKLEEEIEKLKLPLIMCRTKSGGVHLYLFLKDAVNAALVRGKLMEWAIALGHPGVEVFPKQSKLASREDTGNWLNMPYFQHKNTNRFAYKNNKPLNAQEFLDFADECSIDENTLKKIELAKDEELEQAPPCLQHLCARGFPEGSRNNGLFNLLIFAKQKYGDQWKEHADKYNIQFMKPPLPSEEVQKIIKSIDRKNYFYRCNESPIVSVCNKSICLTRKYGIGNATDDMGIIISNLTKIETVPPRWIVAVNGIRIEMENTESLMEQTLFRKICVEKLNILPNRIKSDGWEKND